MKNLPLILVLLVGGCAVMHEPNLTQEPLDKTQYKQDLEECRSEGFKRFHVAQEQSTGGTEVLGIFFGVAGGIVDGITKQNDSPDYDKTVMEMTDECMSRRGYKVKGYTYENIEEDVRQSLDKISGTYPTSG